MTHARQKVYNAVKRRLDEQDRIDVIPKPNPDTIAVGENCLPPGAKLRQNPEDSNKKVIGKNKGVKTKFYDNFKQSHYAKTDETIDFVNDMIEVSPDTKKLDINSNQMSSSKKQRIRQQKNSAYKMSMPASPCRRICSTRHAHDNKIERFEEEKLDRI